MIDRPAPRSQPWWPVVVIGLAHIDTDFGAQNVTSKPATTGADFAAVSRQPSLGCSLASTRASTSPSTSPASPSRPAVRPTHWPGASLAPV